MDWKDGVGSLNVFELLIVKGVRDVMILLEEGKVMLKVNKHETIHEASIIRLLGGKHGVSQ